jgi:two-component system sensor histidine kinase CreC
MTLTARLLLGFVFIAACGLYLICDKVLTRVERQYLEAVEETMVDTAQVLAASLEQDVKEGAIDVSRFATAFEFAKQRAFEAKIYALAKTKINLDAYVVNAQGVVLFDSAEPASVGQNRLTSRDVSLTLAGNYGARSTHTDAADDDSSIMYIGAPIRHGPRIIGMVSVAKPQRAVFQFRDETRRLLRSQISMVILCMVLASFMLARWAARPVERLTEYARAITRGERPTPPKLPGRDMKTLGQAFEKMRDELQGREYVEHYVQTLTHELKSPVAAIQGAAELLSEAPPPEQHAKFLANITTETRRLHDLIDRLLELASLEKRKALDDVQTIPATDLAATAIEHLTPMLQRRSLHVRQDIAPEVMLSGDAFLLECALLNLLKNAIEFSPEGGTIHLVIRQDEETIQLIVEDQGPGVPDFAKDRVFERFYSLPRPGSGHKSSGLGLCFVKEVALLHHGSIALENAHQGGARAVLSLCA